MMMNGTSRSYSRTVRSSSMPSISGIAMSLMITSNDLSRAAFAASRPSPAVTTVNPAIPSVRA